MWYAKSVEKIANMCEKNVPPKEENFYYTDIKNIHFNICHMTTTTEI